jgi:alkyl hydroperoxide reductase subunit AhpF
MEYDVLIVGGGPAGKSRLDLNGAGFSYLSGVDCRTGLGYPVALAM